MPKKISTMPSSLRLSGTREESRKYARSISSRLSMLPDGTSHSTTFNILVRAIVAVAHHMDHLDVAPALQLLQAGADVGARHRNGVGDLLGVQRALREYRRAWVCAK